MVDDTLEIRSAEFVNGKTIEINVFKKKIINYASIKDIDTTFELAPRSKVNIFIDDMIFYAESFDDNIVNVIIKDGNYIIEKPNIKF